MPKEIRIDVRLDAGTFRRFALFDMLKLRKKARKPLVFALIFIAFAVVAMLFRRQESALLASVLLAVGLALPLVYFGTFLSQVNLQAEKQKLKPPRRVYLITLGPEGVTAENTSRKEEPQFLPWEKVPAAYSRKGCVYLYVSPARAWLLPAGQADAPDDIVRQYLKSHLRERARF